MNGLGGLNPSPHGLVLGLVQLALPSIETRADITRQTARVAAMVAKARRNMATLDLVVFPEYALHGLSMDVRDEVTCDLDGPEVATLRQGQDIGPEARGRNVEGKGKPLRILDKLQRAALGAGQ